MFHSRSFEEWHRWTKHGLEHVFLIFLNYFFISQDYSYFDVTLFLSATCILKKQISLTSNTKDRGGAVLLNHLLSLRKIQRIKLSSSLANQIGHQRFVATSSVGRHSSVRTGPHDETGNGWRQMQSGRRNEVHRSLSSSPYLPHATCFFPPESSETLFSFSFSKCVCVFHVLLVSMGCGKEAVSHPQSSVFSGFGATAIPVLFLHLCS